MKTELDYISDYGFLYRFAAKKNTNGEVEVSRTVYNHNGYYEAGMSYTGLEISERLWEKTVDEFDTPKNAAKLKRRFAKNRVLPSAQV